MLGDAWLKLRQAQEAVKNGRLEEAHRLLSQSAAQGHKRSYDVLRQVAQGYVERGEQRLRQEDPAGAWHNLLHAEQVGLADRGADKLRQALTRLGLAEIRALCEAGEPARASEAIAVLRDRLVRHQDLQQFEDGVKDWLLARELADRGEFPLASQMVDRFRRFLPGAGRRLDAFQADLEQRREKFAEYVVQLHGAVDEGRWRDVVQLSDQVLAVAPQNGEARKARNRAWKVLEPVTVTVTQRGEEPPRGLPDLGEAQQRLLLWIDGIGGYLVCLGNRITLGQAVPETTVDVPLFADVSRLHAALSRDAEGYLLEAVRPVLVNGKQVEKALLQAGDRLTLGSSCQIQFQQPVPVSATARLDLVSGHRLALAVDGVILMADTLVVGPGSQVHVPMPDLKLPLVLYRHKDGLGIRYPGTFTVDGQRCQERGQLGLTAVVSGDDFALAIEPVGTGLR